MNQATSYASVFSSQLRTYAGLPEIAAHQALVSMIERFERKVTNYGEQVQRVCEELAHKSGTDHDSSASLANLADAGNSLTRSADLLQETIKQVCDAKPDLGDVVAEKVTEFANNLDSAARASVEKIRSYDVRAALGGLNLRRPGFADVIGVADKVSSASSFLRKAASNIVPNTREAAGKVTTAAKNAANKVVEAGVDYAIRRAMSAQLETVETESVGTTVAKAIKTAAGELISLSEQATADAGNKLFDSHLEAAVKDIQGLTVDELLAKLAEMAGAPTVGHSAHAHEDCGCGHDHHAEQAQESAGPAAPGPDNPCLIFPTAEGPASTGPAKEKKPRKRAVKPDTDAKGDTTSAKRKNSAAKKTATAEKPKAPRKRRTKAETPAQG